MTEPWMAKHEILTSRETAALSKELLETAGAMVSEWVLSLATSRIIWVVSIVVTGAELCRLSDRQ
jgi:hypothetical protein